MAQYAAVKEYGGPELAADYERAFSGTAERLTTALRSAGFHDVTAHEVSFGIALPPLAQYAPGQLSSTSWGQAVVDIGGPDALVRAGHAIHTRLADHTAPDGSATLSFTANLVTGVR